MLVLSRKRLESIQIGDGVRITVVKIDRNQVRLGIEAPGHVPVVREELLLLDDEEQRRDRPGRARTPERNSTAVHGRSASRGPDRRPRQAVPRQSGP